MENQKLVFEGAEYLIYQLPRPHEGEMAYAVDTDKLFIYNNNEWVEYVPQKNNIELSLYDLNKQVISQLVSLTNIEILEKMSLINEYKNKNFINSYFMLYGNEISYFTLFRGEFDVNGLELETLGEAVISCLNELGIIKSIELTDYNSIEIWIETKEDNETTCLYLFPYDNGVIPVRR